MKPEKFVEATYQYLVEGGIDHLKPMLEAPLESIKDEDWRGMISLLKQLTPEQQQAVLNLAKVVAIDTVAGMFGILDGSSCMMENQPDFILKDDNGILNGDLQEIFLSAIQEDGYLSKANPKFGL